MKSVFFFLTLIFVGAFVCVHPVAAILDQYNLSISAQVGSSGGGGGGGGGGGDSSGNATVHFSGRAYPFSKVTILKNGQVAITTISGPDAHFDVALSNLTAHNYTFAVYSTDQNGRNSESISFPIMVTQNVTTDISGIFLSPTIAVDKASVKQGDNLTIFGQSVPNESVVISVHSAVETFHTISTDTSGAYLLTLDTSPLEIGMHETKSKTVLPTEVSPYGKIARFTVGAETLPMDNCTALIGDLNCDTRVNIVDFSIMAYWYGKTTMPAAIDLNHDGRVTIVDFSIMAYYWTG